MRFLTGYRYEPGVQGRCLDDLLVRSLVGAMTAWSFDRLRLWIEQDLSPEAAMRRSVAVATGRALASTAAVLVAATTAPRRSAGARIGRLLAVVVAVLAWVVAVPVERPRANRPLRRAPDRLGLDAPVALAGLRVWNRP